MKLDTCVLAEEKRMILNMATKDYLHRSLDHDKFIQRLGRRFEGFKALTGQRDNLNEAGEMRALIRYIYI